MSGGGASVWRKEVSRIFYPPSFPATTVLCLLLLVRELRVIPSSSPKMEAPLASASSAGGLGHTRLAAKRRSTGPVTNRKSRHKSINTSAFVGTDPTKCPQLPSGSSTELRTQPLQVVSAIACYRQLTSTSGCISVLSSMRRESTLRTSGSSTERSTS